ncbi:MULTISPECIES: hypothetical protein [unclassified Ruegeria]|uniref:hypothetical protein n=1 Tax=unclassified Ruegeria TaxID=2625375 RepID=UPI0014891096|nr:MULTISPECIES: hypothetical protein [unclassified Ruegeria]
MTYGEFEVYDPSAPPELDLSWSGKKKAKEIVDWLALEFQDFGDFDFVDLVSEHVFENFDELQSSVWDQASSSRETVLEYFGNSILANQLDEVVQAVEDHFEGELFPADHRIYLDVSEDGEDEQIEFSDTELAQSIVEDIPSILELLSVVRSDIPESLGHNQGPDFLLKDDELQRLEERLIALKTSLRSPSEQTDELIVETGEGFQKVGSKLAAHVGEMTKISTLKFAEKFGESTGTWAGRAAILVIFGERLLQLLL